VGVNLPPHSNSLRSAERSAERSTELTPKSHDEARTGGERNSKTYFRDKILNQYRSLELDLYLPGHVGALVDGVYYLTGLDTVPDGVKLGHLACQN